MCQSVSCRLRASGINPASTAGVRRRPAWGMLISSGTRPCLKFRTLSTTALLNTCFDTVTHDAFFQVAAQPVRQVSGTIDLPGDEVCDLANFQRPVSLGHAQRR